MSKHRTSLRQLRPDHEEAASWSELTRKLERAQAFAACREGFRAWARAGFPGEDPFSIFREAAAASQNVTGEELNLTPKGKRRGV
ncbi:hypothetical protein [Pelagibius marinus]|uniref:hypothetical protein n=1 Tax=Pelagibius marinus TaxID=2762760 RepID=UPI0018725EB2|nr:hypothetical protein [Pelagibius marinus]